MRTIYPLTLWKHTVTHMNYFLYKAQIENKSSFNTVAIIPFSFHLHQILIRKNCPKTLIFTSQNGCQNLPFVTQFSGVAVNNLVLQTTVTSTLLKNTRVSYR